MSADEPAGFAPRWWRLTLAIMVGLLVGALIGAGAVDAYVQRGSAGSVGAVSVELLGAIALVFRQRWTAAVLAFELAVAAGGAALGGQAVHVGGVVIVAVALYTYGTLRPSARTIGAAVATALTITVADCLSAGSLHPTVPDVALVTAVTAVSLYVRSHRALVVSYRERAEEAEHRQEWTASRAVAAERVRIARELHDVVAHHVSLLVVQAGAVRETLPADHVTRPILESMIDGGRHAMSEMRDMLAALRLDVEAEESSRRPQPTLEQIPTLVSGAQAAGLPVTLQVDGTVVAVSPSISLATYRIVQEGLTNAVKHSPGAFTTVRLAFAPGGLAILVRNGPAPRPPDAGDKTGPGHGIIGMKERTLIAHGTITVGPTKGGWEVSVHLPLEVAGLPQAPLALQSRAW